MTGGEKNGSEVLEKSWKVQYRTLLLRNILEVVEIHFLLCEVKQTANVINP